MKDQDAVHTIPLEDDYVRGEAYEPMTGRWSRVIAPLFIRWSEAASGGHWLDVGCGTGALIQAILDHGAPVEIVGIDRSSAFIAYARRHITDQRVRYEVGDATNLPVASNQYDAVVAGLLLNHLSPLDQVTAVKEMQRAARPGGQVAAYVWDYADGMEPRSRFWQVATTLDPAAGAVDERARYPLCATDALERLFLRCGLNAIETASLEIQARFADFDDFWLPFLAGYGVSSAYIASLAVAQREVLQTALQRELPVDEAGVITMSVRALAVKGVR